MKNVHPGELLREKVINALGLTVTEAARSLSITRPNLSNILNGKSDISPEMCFRIAAVFGGTPEIWGNLQTRYDLAAVSEKMKGQKLTPYQGTGVSKETWLSLAIDLSAVRTMGKGTEVE